MDQVYNVVFIRKWDCYMPGDRAGFVKRLADHLIASHVAEAYAPMPVARRGEELPEDGLPPEDLKRVKESKQTLKLMQEEAAREATAASEKRGMFPSKSK